jgi:hypothetical protein
MVTSTHYIAMYPLVEVYIRNIVEWEIEVAQLTDCARALILRAGGTRIVVSSFQAIGASL